MKVGMLRRTEKFIFKIISNKPVKATDLNVFDPQSVGRGRLFEFDVEAGVRQDQGGACCNGLKI